MNSFHTKVWNYKLRRTVAVSENSQLNYAKRACTTIARHSIHGVIVALMILQITPMALAQNSGLQLCAPNGLGTPNSGKSLGSGSTQPTALACGTEDFSFSLNNRGDATGGAGFSAATARVSGYYNGVLELKGDAGINVLGNMQLNNNSIGGLNAGALSSTSTDAVNGSQLFATNERVTTTEGDITTIQGDITGITTNVTNLDNRVTTVEGDVSNLSTQIDNGSVGMVRQLATGNNLTVGAATDGVAVDFTGTAGARALVGVAAGALSSTSTDAVNGSQLFATNERVTTTEGDITTIQGDITGITTNVTNLDNRVTTVEGDVSNLSTQIDSGSVGMVRQLATGNNLTVGAATDGVAVDFTGTAGARALVGVAAGALSSTSTDAVNGSQLFATNERVTTTEGDITGITTNVTNLDNRVTTVEGDVSNLSTQIDSGSVGMVRQLATGNNLTVGAATDGVAVDFTGTAGARALVGVAAGALSSTSTDAVNGSQLFATNERVTTTEGDITGITTNVTNLDNRVTTVEGDVSNLSTQIDNGGVGMVRQLATGNNLTVGAATDGVAVDFTGTAGARALVGVAAGALSSTSTDAVNGSQLFATNERVTTTEGDITTIQGDITGITTNVTNLDNRVTTVEGDVSNLSTQIDSGSVGMVRQLAAGNNLTVGAATDGVAVDFTGTAGARALVGVAAGALSSTSTDAVNGSQLFATNERVTTTEGDITTIQGDITGITTNVTNLDNRVTTVEGDVSNLSTQIDSGNVGMVRQLAAGNNLTVGAATDGVAVDFTGTAGARALMGVAAGALSSTSTDAVNGSQLFATNERVTTTEGDITTIQGDITGITTNVTNLDNRVTTVEGDVSNLSTQIDSGNVGMVRQLAAGNNLTVGAATDGVAVDFTGTAGARALMGVAAGVLSSTSTDAVNGSQLFGLTQSIATGLGGGAAVNPDGSLSAPSYSVGGVTVNNLGDAITNLDGRTEQNTSAITELANGVVGIGNDLSGLNGRVDSIHNRVSGVEDAIANGNFGNNGLINAKVEGPSQIALATGQDSVASGNASMALGDYSTAMGNNSVASGENSVALGNGSTADRDNTVSVGAAGLERQIANVAAGTEDTDAVNVAQLKQSVQYDEHQDGSINYNSVTLGQAGGAPVTMTNAAKGRIAADSLDVINGGQMWDWTMNRENRDSNASLSHRIDEVERSMQSGIAIALAARQAPYVPGRVSYAAGAAGYKSQAALGISSRYTADSGRWSLEGGFSTSGDGSGVYFGVSGVLGD